MIKLREFWFEDAELKVNINVTVYYVIDNGNHYHLIDYDLAGHMITVTHGASPVYTILSRGYIEEHWEALRKSHDLSILHEANQELIMGGGVK